MNRPEKASDAIHKLVDSIASVFLTDNQGNFIYVNDMFCEITEYDREELIGQSAKILKSGIHSEHFYAELWQTLLSKKRWTGKFCNKTKSGKLVWLETIIDPVLGADGEIAKFAGARIDVTEDVSKDHIVMIHQKQLDAAAKFATIGEIAGYIAHEINNPLTIMTFAITSLEATLNTDNPDLAKVKKLQEKMHTVNNRMIKIASALRNFARNDNTKMEPNSLNTILDDVFLFTADILKTDSVELEVINNLDADVVLECHKNEISQVLINLIKNACDALKNQEKKELKINLEMHLDTLEIRIMDSGARIPDQISDQFFTPYFTTKSEGKGTGIGLTISQKIIEQHGGSIFFDRQCDNSCFVIRLPKKQSSATDKIKKVA